jgi:hypothetical protein
MTEQLRKWIREFLEASEPGNGIGVDLRDGRHLPAKFLSFDGATLRIELTFGEPDFTSFGEPRLSGPIVELPFDEGRLAGLLPLRRCSLAPSARVR